MTFILPILASCDRDNCWSCDKQPVCKIIIKCLVIRILKIDFKEDLPPKTKIACPQSYPCTCSLFYISFFINGLFHRCTVVERSL